MQPIRDIVLVKPLKRNNISEGGLFIPDTVNQVSNKVEVVAVGNRVKQLKQGMVCFRVKDWGEPVEHKSELHYLMTENSIIAIQ